MKLLSVDDARARMLAEISPLPPETVTLADATGRVLAEDVTATRDQPPFNASAMDGWAVRAGDTPGRLTIVGESAAGHGYAGRLEAGQAVRIFTGAAVPAGADAVAIQEDVSRAGDHADVPQIALGRNVRPAGGDFRQGAQLLAKGARIDPWRLSLAAAAGRAELQVYRQPRVVFLGTGEEIVDPPQTPGPYQIYDSGSVALAAMARSWGAVASRRRAVGDDLGATVSALSELDADLIVTIGGASVGDHDLVRAAAAALGLDLKVASIAVRPGKPTFFGTLPDGRRLLGLPGNPASAFVCAELFLRPLVAAYQGVRWSAPLRFAPLAQALPANGPREHWMRAVLDYGPDGEHVRPYGDQDSSLMSVFALSTVLLKRQANAPAAAAGDLAPLLALDRA